MASTQDPADQTVVAAVSLGVLVAVGLVRTAALLVANGISWAGFALAGSGRPLTLALTGTKVWIVVVDVLTIYLLTRLLAREGRSLTPLLTPRPVVTTVLRALAGVVVVFLALRLGSFAANLLVYYGAPPRSDTVMPPVWLGVVRLVVTPVTIAVAEESLYRGYLLPRLQVHLGRAGAVVVASLLAAAQNLAFGMGDWETTLAGFISSFIVGVALGALYLWFKRIAPLVLVHWFFEAVAGLAIFLTALHR
jgi:uncharacterized protein